MLRKTIEWYVSLPDKSGSKDILISQVSFRPDSYRDQTDNPFSFAYHRLIIIKKICGLPREARVTGPRFNEGSRKAELFTASPREARGAFRFYPGPEGTFTKAN